MPVTLSEIKGFFKSAKEWVERLTHLEERVTALEEKLLRVPANGCPFCGERAMRLKESLGPLGYGDKKYQQETWECNACGKMEPKIKRF